MGWEVVTPWRIVDGSGQLLTASGAGIQTSSVVPKGIYAVAIRLAPAATPYLATIAIGSSGEGSSSKDYPIASTDPPQILKVSEGQFVNVDFPGAGSAQLCWVSP